MSDNKDNKVPLECPSVYQPKKVDPIVDVVQKETFPTANVDVNKIISKSPQE